MNKLLLTCIFSIFCAFGFAQAPNISYTSPQVYTLNTTITPLSPANTGGAVSGGIYSTVSTLAGTTIIGSGSANGTGASANFYNPSGVTTDNAGNIYVADQSNNLIRKITPAGVVTTLAGNTYPNHIDGTGSNAYFNNPCGVAVDANGNVYVTDRYNNCIRKVSPTGVVTTLAGSGSESSVDGTGTAASFNYPYGITIDASGNLFVAEQHGQRIRKITPDGIVTTVAGNSNTGSLNGTGTAATFYNPTGVAVDASGNLYVTDNAGNLIRKITPAGVVSTLAGNGIAGAVNGTGSGASFNQPTGINVDAAGRLYVADQGNNMIRVITPDGIVSTLAGTGVAGSANALGINAQFSRPTGVAIVAGNIYVADYTNNLIRSVVTTGYSIFPALPAGLTMDSQTGIISGTPTAATSARNYTVYAQNISGISAANVNIATVPATAPPTITAFNPVSATPGTNIVINGTNLLNAASLTIGGRLITTFNVVSQTKIIAVIPAGAVSGSVTVTNSLGSGTLSGLVVLTPPNITYASPNTYNTGAAITPLLPANSGSAIPSNLYSQVTTFAGNGSQGVGVGVATASNINLPVALATDAKGNIYVAESTNTIKKITPAGNATLFAGSYVQGAVNGSASAASFYNPTGLVFDLAGNMYVADSYNHLIRKITPAGIVSTFAGSGVAGRADGVGTAASFNYPSGIVIDSYGNLFVTDMRNATIRKITPDGTVTTFAGSGVYGSANGTGLNATFTLPKSIAIDISDNLYILEVNAFTIRKITPAGVVTTYAGAQSSSQATDGPVSTASLYHPLNITTDVYGNLFVSEQSGLIRQISPAGMVTTLAGTINPFINFSANSLDGIGTSAGFNYPNGLVSDNAGNLYVADQNSNLIRKISLTGYAISPALPPGLALNNTGAITGTPLAVSAGTDYTIKAVSLGGVSTAVTNIKTVVPALPPTISGVSPAPAGYAQTITITGTNLLGATAVKIGAVSIGFTAVSPFTITAKVSTHTSGNVSVTTPYGTATSAFTIADAPNISYTSPQTFTVNTAIANLTPVNSGSAIPNKIYAQTTTFVHNNSAGNPIINHPRGITTDIAGNIYVSDDSYSIRKITPDGVVTILAGTSTKGSANGNSILAGFYVPGGVGTDGAGNVYVADQYNNLIRKITPDGVVTTFAGSGVAGKSDGIGTAASFNGPTGIAVDASGNVFVAEPGNNLIRKITPAGVVSTFAGSGTSGSANGTGVLASFASPNGIAVDVSGNLYITDGGNYQIRKITPAGVVTSFAGGTRGMADGLGAAAQFDQFNSICTDVSGNIYVGDFGNERIRIISPDGLVKTLAGSGIYKLTDGIGTAADFGAPWGVTADGYGNLYVADADNFAIRKIAITGYTITPALPDGLSFDAATGTISGTPNVSSPVTSYSITGYNTNGSSTTTLTLDIKIPATPPTITSFTPTNAGANNTITITGTNFTDATAVEIGGLAALNYQVVSKTTIVAIVASGATGSNVKVTNAYGTATGTGFTYVQQPAISYQGAKIYTTGNAITPLSITSSGGAIPNALYGQNSIILKSPIGTTNWTFDVSPNIVSDASSNIYVAYAAANQFLGILKITPAGVVTTFAGGVSNGFVDGAGAAASFKSINSITIDWAGNLYVADAGNYAIRKITPAGVVSTFFKYNGYNYADGFSPSSRIAADLLGNIYVSDGLANTIKKISATGIVTAIAGVNSQVFGSADGPGALATFTYPEGIAVDSYGNLYIADSQSNKIRKISPAGIVSTLAGSGTAGKQDGTGSAASFNNPVDITLDGAGNLYVTDNSNNLIRKITPQGVVTTFANDITLQCITTDASGNIYLIDALNKAIRKIASNGYAVSPALPPGLTLDGTGTITGTPTAISPATDYTITAYNAGGSTTTTVNIQVTISTTPPVITTFAQPSQIPGSGITIIGNNFLGTTAVSIGGVAAASFTVVSPTTITAYPAPGAVSGSIIVTNAYGSTTQGGLVFNTAPNISYGNTLNLTAGTAITPIVPTNSGTAIPALAYGQLTTIADSRVVLNGTNTFPPGFVITDSQGNMYVSSNNIIRKITPDHVVTILAGSTSVGAVDGVGAAASFSGASNMVMDAAGNIFVVDRGNNMIRKVTPAGVVTTVAGNGKAATVDGIGTQASLNTPMGIAIDGAGNLYFTERSITSSRVRKITPAGVVSTIAGSGTAGYKDGIGTDAMFNYPMGIVSDFAGNLYVADELNSIIRKITPTGVVTTFAGNIYTGLSPTNTPNDSEAGAIWISMDNVGNFYVTDGSPIIKKISPAGAITAFAIQGQVPNPGYAAGYETALMDASGNLILNTNLTNNSTNDSYSLLQTYILTGYTISPALPAGLNFDSATGTISGTPQYASATPLTYTVTGYNSVGSNITTVSFTVGVPAAPNINYAGPQTYTVSNPISYLYPTNTGGGIPLLGLGYTTTLAGSGVGGMDNGSALSASFNAPSGIIVDKQNNIYVAQTGNPMIRKITPDGTVSTFAGNGTSSYVNGPVASASFISAVGLAINSKGDMFVTDGNGRGNGYTIRKISNGVISTFAGDPNNVGFVNATGTAARFNGSSQIAIDNLDNIFVADQQNNVIRKITPDAVVTTFAGSGTQGATDGMGTAASFYNPNAIVIDANGNLFITDTKNNRIRKITPDGVVSTFAGNGAPASVDGVGISASFNYPTGIAIDLSGNLYVADYHGNVIRRITPGGVVTTIAGNGYHASIDTKDNQAAESFSGPVCVTLSNNSQSLYVTDFDGNRIRKIDLYGYTIDKPLPSGLYLDKDLGAIHGIPAVASPAANYTVTAYNAGGSSSAVVNISVAKAIAPNISYNTPQHIDINQPVTIPLSNKGGRIPGNAYATTASITTTVPNPVGIASDRLGHLFIADQSTYSIREVNGPVISYFAGGGYASTASDGLTTSARFTDPTGIAIDAQDNLLVTERLGAKIRQVTPKGVVSTLSLLYYTNNTYTSVTNTPLNYPYGITVDGSGNIFVSDQYYNVIRKITTINAITPSKLVTIFAGSGSSGSANGNGAAASFNQPAGLVTDIAGNLYVADKNNNLIRKITPAGDVTTFAGSGSAGAANGTGTAASFNQPTDLTIDASGNIYVVDRGNNMIRMITPAGVVTTLAGSITTGSTNGVGTAARFNAPTGITIDPTGKLNITENNTSLRSILITGYTIDQTLPAGLIFNNTDGSISGTPTALTAAKDYNVTAYNYGGSSSTALNITVQSKADQVITFPLVANPTYGDDDVALNATSTGTTLPLNYTTDNTNVATIVNGKLHIIGAGVVTVTVSQAGDATHNTAGSITQAITINPKAITVNASPLSKTYGDADPVLTYTITSGSLLGTDAFTGVLNRDQGEGAGIYNIAQGTLALNSNYTLTFSGSKFTVNPKAVTVTANALSKTYGDADPAFTYTITSGNLIGTDAFTGILNRDQGEGAGIYNIAQGTLALNSNYALTFIGNKFTINPKSVTVTANALSKTYGDADPAFTYTITSGNLIGTDAFTGILNRDQGEGAGIYNIAQGTLALNSNYALTFSGSKFAINPKAVTVTANALSKTYGDADPAFTYTITSGSLVGTDAFTGNMYKDQGENAGIYNINQGTLALNGNYKLTFTGNKFTINKKPLTATALDVTWSYGRVTSNLPVQYSGFAFADDVTKLTAQPVVTTAANPSALVPGVYDLVPGNGVADNYSFVYVNGKLTVTLPSTSFKIASTSVTCKGSNNGIITITPTSALNYTAVVTGGGLNQTYHFNSTLTIGSLAPATYHVCVSADNLPGDQQCSDVIITEPKDLAVYATVNKTVNTVTLALSGSDNYTVKINGTEYQTSGSSITLPLNKGSNKISVNTDKPCQGSIEQMIDLSGITAPYPNPFQSVLYVNLGESISASATISIFNMTDGRQVLNQKFNNMSGVVRLDVASLKTGVYTLNLTLDGKLSTFKIVKQ